MVLRNNAFERRVDDFNRRGGKYVEVERITIDAGFENLIERLDVAFETNTFSSFVKMLFAHLGFELWVVKQQVGELRTLLHQIDLRHAFGFALELGSRNADEFGGHVAGVIEGERLIEVARKDIAF